MRSPFVVLSSVSLLLFVSAAACGGAVSSVDDAGPGGGGQDNDAGHAGQDGSTLGNGNTLGVACPTSAPQGGSSCAPLGLTCEYGGEGDHLRCSTLFTCEKQPGGAGGWTPEAPNADCVGTQTDNAPACPATFGALASASACPVTEGDCVYPEGVCACEPCSSPDGGGAEKLWSCKAWPTAPAGCPSPRPRAGSTCTEEGKSCFYGAVCTAVDFDQPNLQCKGGLWQDEPIAQPPCAFPFCGQ